MNIYLLKDGDIEIKVVTNLNEEEMEEAIEGKDELINYSDNPMYETMTDFEILESIIRCQGDYIEEVVAAECKILILNEKLEVEE